MACYTCQLRCRGKIGSLPGPNFAGQFKMVSTLSRKPTCAPSRHWLRSFPYVAVETVPMIIWLTMALFRPFKEGSRPIHTLSAPLSFWRSMMWRHLALWLQVAVSQVPQCLKLLNTSHLPRRKPLVLVAFPAGLSSRSLCSPWLHQTVHKCSASFSFGWQLALKAGKWPSVSFWSVRLNCHNVYNQHALWSWLRTLQKILHRKLTLGGKTLAATWDSNPGQISFFSSVSL